jgi:hypothetical protein
MTAHPNSLSAPEKLGRPVRSQVCPVPLLVVFCYMALPLIAAENADYKSLFNGKDLTGWVNINCAPETFSARDGMIVTTGKPTGLLRTEKQYENFEIDLEWRHIVPGGNSGLYVWSDPITAPGQPFSRAIEVQVLDGRNTATYTSHGDVFAIHGAHMKPDHPHPEGWERCLPNERRCKPAGEWNHYHVVCNNGDIKLAVNGKVVSGASNCTPRKGYICIEAEGSECHFRNIRVKELPSTNPSATETATLAEGFVPLYTGLNLKGWKNTPAHDAHWTPDDWILKYDGKCEAPDPHLWTIKEYKDFVLICDWRWSTKGSPAKLPVILPNGDEPKNADGSPKTAEVMDAGDSGIYLRGSSKSQVNIWCWPVGSGEVYGYRTDAQMPAEVRAAATPKTVADKPIGEWNRFVITMRGERLTVNLNGKIVIESAQLPGVPRRGPIALQHHGYPIEFANIFIKEL